jgi:hypothetical protein
MKDPYTTLRNLAYRVVEIFEDLKRQGIIKPTTVTLLRYRFVNLRYDENDGIRYDDIKPEFINYELLNEEALQLLLRQVQNHPLYLEALQYITTIYMISYDNAVRLLNEFVATIAQTYVSGVFNDEAVEDTIVAFIDDATNSPALCEDLAHLYGLVLGFDEVDLGSGVRLRRPKQDDLFPEYPMDMVLRGLAPLPIMLSTMQLPSAILEVKQKAHNEMEPLGRIERLVMTLRLYKPCSVFAGLTWITCKTLVRSMRYMGTFSPQELHTPIIYNCKLGIEEVDTLREFINEVEPYIQTSYVYGEPRDYLSIALQRYSDALFKVYPIERLTYAIMGLEALYLTGGGEQTHRLAQRVSRVMGLYGFSPLGVYDEIRQAYDLRSKFVHGGAFAGKEIEFARQLVNKVVRYLQLSILTFLELKHKAGVSKEDIIKIIDSSLLDIQQFQYLERHIKEKCRIITSIAKTYMKQ